MFEETASAFLISTSPWGVTPANLYMTLGSYWFFTRIYPGSLINLLGEIIFSSRAAEAKNGFMVDPVGYFAPMARLKNGCDGSFKNLLKSDCEIPLLKILSS